MEVREQDAVPPIASVQRILQDLNENLQVLLDLRMLLVAQLAFESIEHVSHIFSAPLIIPRQHVQNGLVVFVQAEAAGSLGVVFRQYFEHGLRLSIAGLNPIGRGRRRLGYDFSRWRGNCQEQRRHEDGAESPLGWFPQFLRSCIHHANPTCSHYCNRSRRVSSSNALASFEQRRLAPVKRSAMKVSIEIE